MRSLPRIEDETQPADFGRAEQHDEPALLPVANCRQTGVVKASGHPAQNVGFSRVHDAFRATPLLKGLNQEARWRRVLAEVDPVMMPLLSSPHATWQFNL